MSDLPNRPHNLPDFKNPPLNEVVLGVQFQPARKYTQIRAGEVWALFRSTFPNVEEHPAITPAFETFGPPMVRMFNLGVGVGAQHNRFWFLSERNDEVIQFQHDRFLHNWRKTGDQDNTYPRFESMAKNYVDELEGLEKYFNTLEAQSLNCNQAEISYVNHIPLLSERQAVSDWVQFLHFAERDPSDFYGSYRRIITGTKGTPVGRLIVEFRGPEIIGGKRMLILSLAARGAPADQTIRSAEEFLKLGRKMIVNEFAAITTDYAHKLWGRSQ